YIHSYVTDTSPLDSAVDFSATAVFASRAGTEVFVNFMNLRALRGSVARVLMFAGVCTLVAWMPVTSLRADGNDVRLIDAVKRRDDKAFTSLLRAKADL